MDIEKCKLLLKAIEKGSFSAAAAALGYTPSGVTRAVNSLEDELGFPLVSRTAKGIAVTTDGARVLPAMRQLIYWDRQIREQSAQITGLVVGEVNVGAYFSVACNWLPPIIKAFQNDYPSVQVHVVEGSSKGTRQKLEERQLDCAILAERPYDGDWIFLKRDEVVVWLPPDHPRAHDAVYPFRELENEDFIEELPGMDTDIDELRYKEGLKLHVVSTSVDNYTSYRMVEAGLGVSINNRLMTETWHGSVAVLPLDPPHYINLGIFIPSLKEASPAVRTFIQYVKKAVK